MRKLALFIQIIATVFVANSKTTHDSKVDSMLSISK